MQTHTMTSTDPDTPQPLASEGPRRSWFAPVTGLGFVAVIAASYSVAPMPPDPDATSGAIRTYFLDNATGVRTSALLQSLAAVLLLLFVCGLSETLRTKARRPLAATAVLGAGILTLAASLTAAALSATLASGVVASADAGLLRALSDLGRMALNVGDPMVAALVGVYALATSRSPWAPRWLTALGLAVTGTWTVGTVSVIVTAGPFASPTGPYGLAMVTLLIVWVAAVSLVLPRVVFN